MKNSFERHFPVKKQVSISKSALDACNNAEAIVIATEWKEFKEIDWKTVYSRMSKPAFLFDGRLLLDADKLREIGFKVCSSDHGVVQTVVNELLSGGVYWSWRVSRSYSVPIDTSFRPTGQRDRNDLD